MNHYIFQTARLGFRNWGEGDILPMAEINADEAVMEYFPAKLSVEDTRGFIKRMQLQLAEKEFCYFAVDIIESREFIGFIGLSQQIFAADFTPCIDIGWRLKRSAWNKGYATEGAVACLNYGFGQLDLEEIYAMAPLANVRSVELMKKIGMIKRRTFEHPMLLQHASLKNCVLYIKKREDHYGA